MISDIGRQVLGLQKNKGNLRKIASFGSIHCLEVCIVGLRGGDDHLTSFDSNFYFANDFFDFRNMYGIKSGECGEWAAVRSLIRTIWLWRRCECEPKGCHGGRAPFSPS